VKRETRILPNNNIYWAESANYTYPDSNTPTRVRVAATRPALLRDDGIFTGFIIEFIGAEFIGIHRGLC